MQFHRPPLAARPMHQVSIAGLLAMILTGCGVAPGLPHPAPAPALPSVPTAWTLNAAHPCASEVPGVINFGFVSADVWRGTKPTTQGMRSLAAMGVKTIIDLQEDDETAELPAGIQYVRLTVSGWQADQVDVKQVLAAIADAPKPVFIHCQMDRDRTGLAIAAYRLWQGMNEPEAIEELRNFHVNLWWEGPIINRINALKRQGLIPVKSSETVR